MGVPTETTPDGGGGGGVSSHGALTGRSAVDQHPTSAVTGLEGALDATAKLVNTDGDPGDTFFVGSVDPTVNHTPEVGDYWIDTGV